MGAQFFFYILILFFAFNSGKGAADTISDSYKNNLNYNMDLSSFKNISKKMEFNNLKKLLLTKNILKGIGTIMMIMFSVFVILDKISHSKELENYRKREEDLTSRLKSAENDMLSSREDYGKKVEEIQSVINKIIFHTLNNKNIS
ncbi:conserved Plasmodium protein, unknown function [Plasmodium malariae]|uniref:Uncharacterized protein n=1 Tax=Plasmodium malariae TaxID=5858 RepID=A0A1C3L2D7_PLAMA|nr:conserved Plasmodium protein, unknown function [Plasmodium malariae]